MSAFLVSNKTISKLANMLPLEVYKNGEEIPAELAKKLYNLNVRALRERYDDPENMIVPLEYDPALTFPDIYQAYKSISCYLYQCSEGSVPKTALYKRVEQYQKTVLATRIAERAVEEKNTTWE